MRKLLSKDVLLSIWKTISLKQQTRRSKKAILEMPNVIRVMLQTLRAAPYLVLAYLIIAAIDVQHRIGGPIDETTAAFSSLISLALLTAANALCYVESYNKHTTAAKITKAGRYVAWRALKLVAVIILSSFIILIGLFMFVIPGVYFSLRLSLAPPACIIDDLSVIESLRQSIRATKGQVTLVYTVFSSFGLLFIPTGLILITSTGSLRLIMVFVLYGLCPPLIHTALATLYLNATDDNTVSLYMDSTEKDGQDSDSGSSVTTSAAVGHTSPDSD